MLHHSQVQRVFLFTCECFPHPILLLEHKVLCCFLSKTENITLSSSIKETHEMIDSISEALMSDHSVAIKHFVRRICEVLSTRIIQLARDWLAVKSPSSSGWSDPFQMLPSGLALAGMAHRISWCQAHFLCRVSQGAINTHRQLIGWTLTLSFLYSPLYGRENKAEYGFIVELPVYYRRECTEFMGIECGNWLYDFYICVNLVCVTWWREIQNITFHCWSASLDIFSRSFSP